MNGIGEAIKYADDRPGGAIGHAGHLHSRQGQRARLDRRGCAASSNPGCVPAGGPGCEILGRAPRGSLPSDLANFVAPIASPKVFVGFGRFPNRGPLSHAFLLWSAPALAHSRAPNRVPITRVRVAPAKNRTLGGGGVGWPGSRPAWRATWADSGVGQSFKAVFSRSSVNLFPSCQQKKRRGLRPGRQARSPNPGSDPDLSKLLEILFK